jgi:hypothetical protein
MTQVYGTARAVSSTPVPTTAMRLVTQRHAVRMELAGLEPATSWVR